MKKLTVTLLISTILCLSCQSQSAAPRDLQIVPTPTYNSPPKEITAATLPFRESWRWSGIVFAAPRRYPPAVVMAKDRVIVAGYDGVDRKVIAFDAYTGNIAWESDYIDHLDSLHTQNNYLYVGTLRYVSAFDTATGNLLWEGAEQPINKKGSLDVYATDDQVQVYDFIENTLYFLDQQTGQTLEELNHPFIFFKKDDIIYSGCGYGFKTPCLYATNSINGEPLWSHNFNGLVHFWPIFSYDNEMLINAGRQIYAIDVRNGEIIWRSDSANFITGVALGDDTAYALRYDAAIVGFDPKTGEQNGLIEISPNRTLEDDGSYVKHYAIAASDEFVAVYYGNSEELIVFEKTDNFSQ